MTVTTIELLKKLNEGHNYLIGIDDYKEIGVKDTDNFNLFTRKENTCKFKLLPNSTRANLNVQQIIYGTTKINPIQASKVNLPYSIKSHIYRDKTIICDGKLNITFINVICDEKTLSYIISNNIKYELLPDVDNNEGTPIKIDLTSTEIISNDYISLGNIEKRNKAIITLKSQKKVLKYFLNEYSEPIISRFSDKQLELLSEHGLTPQLQYVGIYNVQQEVKEKYTADIIEFKLKNSSSINAMLKRINEGKKLSAEDEEQYKYFNEIKNYSNFDLNKNEMINILQNKLEAVENELSILLIRNVQDKINILNTETALSTMDNLTSEMKIVHTLKTFER